MSTRAEKAAGIYAAGLSKVATTPMPTGQKFPVGTFVWISKDLGPSMSHFKSDCPARVEYTYAHAYLGDNVDSYSLLIRYAKNTWSTCAWYNEHQLTEITDKDKIKEYENEITQSLKDDRQRHKDRGCGMKKMRGNPSQIAENKND